MKKSILSAIISIAAIAVFAAEVDFNGGFEKFTPDKSGVPQANHWNKTRTISKKAECRLVKDADCVKSGTFALIAETINIIKDKTTLIDTIFLDITRYNLKLI